MDGHSYIDEKRLYKKKVDGMRIQVNGKKGLTYRGFGMVSANNSSKLLLDYKREHEKSYWEILTHIFGEDGLAISHLKIEMGSDVNSSSGTEPAVIRYEGEPADVSRGAGFILCRDAKTINPDLTLDMLWWSEPRWVTDAADRHEARYQWYRKSLIAAYEQYGLVFDYVSANRNEREVDDAWIKYLSARLKGEQDAPYDFSKIKIVAADEDCSWRIGDHLLADPKLREAVDVIGSHYTSFSTDAIKQLSKEAKEIWFSEGCPPLGDAKAAYRVNGSGLCGINFALDIANRIIAMTPCGAMNLYEFQPVVSAYYDGACYSYKQLICANTPWNGSYELDMGYYIALHFSAFMKKGWRYVEDACCFDGKPGEDPHTVCDAKHSFITLVSPDGADYAIVLTNTSGQELAYEIDVPEGVKESYIYTTTSPESVLKKETLGTDQRLQVAISPDTIVTISSLDRTFEVRERTSNEILSLPYADDFSGEPRYTTDQGGAFEADNGWLKQKITENLRAEEWGYTPNPVTCLGDDRWYNYGISVDIALTDEANSYIGIGIRHSIAADEKSGYAFFVYANRRYALYHRDCILREGTLFAIPENIGLKACADHICAEADGKTVIELEDALPGIAAGRVALYSSYHENCFRNLRVVPCENPYVQRVDCTELIHSSAVQFQLMTSFKNHLRTQMDMQAGDTFAWEFYGTGFLICGRNEAAGKLRIVIDESGEETAATPVSYYREVIYAKHGLMDGLHKVKVTALEPISIDYIETCFL